MWNVKRTESTLLTSKFQQKDISAIILNYQDNVKILDSDFRYLKQNNLIKTSEYLENVELWKFKALCVGVSDIKMHVQYFSV